ncbi:MAG: DUF2254 domain-containing protein [Planctomycetales bacterium]|nr:DUF2254 domain-containing protein [Planctomycetales bacterium]
MWTWLANLWRTVSSSFWFFPGASLLAGLCLAIFMPVVDQHIGDRLPAVLRTTAPTARATISALCGAMFTVTGVVFSTTIVALSITSAQLGPRLLRNFLRQMTPQITLAICMATSVYCLVLLRRVDEIDGKVFVPHLSVALASVLGVATLLMIVIFIHRVSHSIQAQNVVSDVADDLDSAISRLFPERIGEPPDPAADKDSAPVGTSWETLWQRFDDEESSVVRADRDGYIQAVDDSGLLALAEKQDALVRLNARPGDYVREGQPLLYLLPRRADEDDLPDAEICRMFILGNTRTTQQDVECAVNELVEVALRALSPGINDSFTAIACIDRLSGTMRRLARRRMPAGGRCNEDRKPRLVAKPREFSRVVDAAFNQIRQNAAGNVAVSIRLLDAIEAIGAETQREEDRQALLRQADMIGNASTSAPIAEDDRRDLLQRHERLVRALERRQDEAASEWRQQGSEPQFDQSLGGVPQPRAPAST